MVRREISSTLGLKAAISEFLEARESRPSQGDNCKLLLLLRKKLFLCENAIPNVKPSDIWTVVSEHGENTPFVSLDSATNDDDDDNVTRTRINSILSIVELKL